MRHKGAIRMFPKEAATKVCEGNFVTVENHLIS